MSLSKAVTFSAVLNVAFLAAFALLAFRTTNLGSGLAARSAAVKPAAGLQKFASKLANKESEALNYASRHAPVKTQALLQAGKIATDLIRKGEYESIAHLANDVVCMRGKETGNKGRREAQLIFDLVLKFFLSIHLLLQVILPYFYRENSRVSLNLSLRLSFHEITTIITIALLAYPSSS